MSTATLLTLLPVFLGAAMLLVTISTRRGESADAAFEDIKDMYDRVKLERDDLREKYARGEITIAQLREQVAVLTRKEIALRAIMRNRGITAEEMP